MPRSRDVIEPGFYSIGMLKTAISVSRRSIERAIEAGHIKPCCYTVSGRRARFSQEQVEDLRCRAKKGRSRGLKYVMGHITSIGTKPTKAPRVAPSASAWVRKKVVKHNPAMLASYKVAMKYLDLDAMIED